MSVASYGEATESLCYLLLVSNRLPIDDLRSESQSPLFVLVHAFDAFDGVTKVYKVLLPCATS